MANVITPMVTNLVSSGKKLSLTSTIDYDVGEHGTGRAALVELAAASIDFDQMIPFQIDITAAQAAVNLWEAPSAELRARALMVVCLYGAVGIIINQDTGAELPFPLASDGTKYGWLFYVNPDGTGLVTGTGDTGPGIQQVTAETENEARVQGYVFI